jgi:hypothetical protein
MKSAETKAFWCVYRILKEKHPAWTNKKLMYVTHKLVNK